ncbi:zinc metalloprotease [Marinigracilibium pacificum]|uniref:Zinc metalloprotease n=1 Tax=Marinigracilibium pacificum TaxID=2729599 RepID=A0A848JCX5_9BACT|nr:zinc metalloprotease [Marinigracilibium pacificum]NMM50852.1 zinc metalloprotease [Marinigracilibium pacificum]
MKKVLLLLFVTGFIFTACNDESTNMGNAQDQQEVVDMSDFYLYTFQDDEAARTTADKSCHTMKVLNRQLDENPGLYKKMYNVEKHVRQFIASKKPDGTPGGGNGGGGNGGGGEDPVDDGLGAINIPVYVHVIYSNSQENISDAQIQSQIDILNADFNLTNSDASLTPAEFAGVVADVDVNFTLAGVTRKASSRTSWGTRDEMKFASNGGVDVVTPESALNIWVCNIGGGILGYAQFPGGNPATDGVVVGPEYFGDRGYVAAPFDKGRTTTHEVGHYLNLRHIWGDGRCKQDDFVADTPSSDGPNYGCPAYPTVNCRSNDMTMNYMDYVNDECMYMFSEGQKARMRALFTAGGARESMYN